MKAYMSYTAPTSGARAVLAGFPPTVALMADAAVHEAERILADVEHRDKVRDDKGLYVPLAQLHSVVIGSWPPVDGGIAQVALAESLARFVGES